MRKIICLILASLLIVSCFVGCAKQETQEPTNDATTNTTSPDDTSDDQNHTEPTNTVPEKNDEPTQEEIEQMQKELEAQYKAQLDTIKVELLSVDRALSFKEYFWEDGYYVDQKYGGVGTMITVGIDYGSSSIYDIVYGIDIAGETATDPDDPTKEAWQYDKIFTTKDDTYSIVRFIVQGDVDTSKAHLRIETELENVYREIMFENNGEPVGYENAIAKYSSEDDNMGMDSGIIKLKGRHYKVIYRGKEDSWTKFVDYETEDPSKGVNIFVEYKLALLPLEKGNRETLKTADVAGDFIDKSLKRDDMKFTYNVDRANVFGGANPIHTVLTIEAKYTINEPAKLTEDGYIDNSQYIEQEKELTNSISNLQFTTKDEDGKIETVFQVLKAA